MSELTPIPAAHRHLYHEALRAGLAEAERRELDLDALPFAEFHRALYRPLLDAHEAEVRAKVAEEIAEAITINVRNHDFTKQDRGVWAGFTERMAYVSGHDKAAAIALQHARSVD